MTIAIGQIFFVGFTFHRLSLRFLNIWRFQGCDRD